MCSSTSGRAACRAAVVRARSALRGSHAFPTSVTNTWPLSTHSWTAWTRSQPGALGDPPQDVEGGFGERDGAPRLGGLRLGDPELAAEAGEGAPDADEPLIEVHVGPGQRERLAAAQPGVHEELEEHPVPGVAGGLEEQPDLCRLEELRSTDDTRGRRTAAKGFLAIRPSPAASRDG